MTAVSQSNMAAPTPDFSGVEFATSTAGRPVARIGDVVLAIITPASGFALSATGSALSLISCAMLNMTGRPPSSAGET